MATTQGTVFMTALAIGPPAIATACYLHNASWMHDLSLAIQTTCALLYSFIIYRGVLPYFTSPLRHLPTPPNCRLITGYGFSLIKQPPGVIYREWLTSIPNDGLINARGFFHWNDFLLATTPETVMEVLNVHCYDYQKPGPARKLLTRVLGKGLVVVEGNEHKMQRKGVTPAFSGRHIKDLLPLFWSKGEKLVDAMKRELDPSDGSIEIRELASRATLDIIGSAGIGKDFCTTEDATHELAAQYAMITDTKKGNMVLYFGINLFFPQWLVRRLPIQANARVANAVVALRRITGELLIEKSNEMREKSVEQKDIIAILMRSQAFDDDGLTNQLLTFLAAGHETTASALTWTTYLISKHPHVQDRLREECLRMCSNLVESEISADIIDSMPYLDAVCSEVLRLYPTVPVTVREAIRKTRIGDVVVPKGTAVLICPWALNRSPLLWGDDAEEFRPERWLHTEKNHGGSQSPYAFITFLHGPRSCIGQSFARYELKCLLAVLVLRFSLQLKYPHKVPVPAGAITIKPRDGMELIVTPL